MYVSKTIYDIMENYLPPEEHENECAECGTPCDNEYCSKECFINSHR